MLTIITSRSMTENNFDDNGDVDDDDVDDDDVDKSIFLNLISYKAVTIRLRQDQEQMVGEMESGLDTRFPLDMSNLITQHQQRATKHKLELIKSKSMSPKNGVKQYKYRQIAYFRIIPKRK